MTLLFFLFAALFGLAHGGNNSDKTYKKRSPQNIPSNRPPTYNGYMPAHYYTKYEEDVNDGNYKAVENDCKKYYEKAYFSECHAGSRAEYKARYGLCRTILEESRRGYQFRADKDTFEVLRQPHLA
jgi:hypothetical protein